MFDLKNTSSNGIKKDYKSNFNINPEDNNINSNENKENNDNKDNLINSNNTLELNEYKEINDEVNKEKEGDKNIITNKEDNLIYNENIDNKSKLPTLDKIEDTYWKYIKGLITSKCFNLFD